MSRTRSVRRARRQAETALDDATDTAARIADGVRSQIDDLDVPGRVRSARRDLADAIDPAPRRRRGRRALRLSLLAAALGAVAWAVLSRRPSELEPWRTADG